MQRLRTKSTLLSGLCLSALVCSGSAAAQTGDLMSLEEIVVTASKRAQNLQDVPAAVSAISYQQLQSRGIRETSDLMGALPNLQVTSAYSTTQPNFSLRGISVANEFSAATASPVGVYVDEVYQSFRAAHGQQLFDLERIEVLRGPQGTLYGRNTTGGAINFISRKPSLSGGNGYITGGYGNFDTFRALGAVEANPIEDVFGVRIAGTVVNSRGYTFNPVDNQYYAQTDSVAGRFSARWKPSDKLDINFKLFAAENSPRQDLPYGIGYLAGRSDSAGYSRFAPRPELGGRTLNQNEVQADTAGDYFTSSYGGALTIEYEVNDRITITSITGYDEGEYELSPFDCDGSPNDVCAIRYFSDSQNFNQDLRVTYDGDRVKLIGGVYYGRDEIFTENEPDFFGFLRPLLEGAGLPGTYSNIPIAEPDSLAVIPAFLVDATLSPVDDFGAPTAAFCAGIPVHPNGFFAGRPLIAFNADIANGNNAVGAACAAAGAPPVGPILANQQFTIARPSTAIYGEADISVTDDFSIIIGLRYTWDEVKLQDASTVIFTLDGTTPLANLVPFSNPFDPSLERLDDEFSTGRLTGRVVLNYQVAEDVLAYASYSRGYRAGTYNALAYQGVNQVYPVAPEEVDAFEIGVKSRFFDNRIQLNVAGFYYDYKNQQIAQIVGATSFLRNASGKVLGFEAEFQFQASDWLRFDGSFGYLDTEYDDTVLDPNDPTALTLPISGNPFPNAPEFTAQIGMDITAWESADGESSLYFRFDAQYMGEYFFDPFANYGQDPCDQPIPAGQLGTNGQVGTGVLLATPELACGNPDYILVNARATYQINENFSVSAWARNLTDKFYYTYGLNLNAFYQDYLTRGAPRTWGFEATVSF